MNTTHVLLVADRSTDVELCRREVLRILPVANITRIASHDALVDTLRSTRPDIILCSDCLSDLTGMTALQLALEHAAEIPFILILDALHEELAATYLKAGAWNYILRDHPRRLGPVIQVALEQKQLRRENQQVMARLRESEERYRSLFEGNQAVMLLLDPDSGRIIDANAAAATYYGWSRDELCRKKISEINILSPDEVQQEEQRARRVGCNHCHFRHRRADGVVREVEVYSGSLASEGVLLTYAIVHDVTDRKRAETGRRLAQFCIDQASIGIFQIDETGRILEANRHACASLGYTREELCKQTVFDIDPTFSPQPWPHHRERIMAHEEKTIETLHRRKDGSTFPVEVSINYFEYEGQVLSFSFARNISERKRAENELHKLSQIVEQSPAVVVLTDLAGNIEYVNPRFTVMTGYQFEEVRGRNPRILKSGKMSSEDYQQLWATIASGNEWHGELYNRRKDGTFFWERALITPVRDAAGDITHFLAIKEDITERKQQEGQLQHLATHDQLTGLANRTLLNDRLQQSIHYADRSQRLVAVMLLDLDRFKIINDSLGHSVGDDLLREMGQRLKSVVRQADTVARLGGDEFVVLLAEIAEEPDVGVVANKILQILTWPYLLNDREVTVSASIGISLYPRDAVDGESLLRNADIAMYRAKEEGNSFCFYAPEMNLRVHERLELESDLRRALERGELLLHFQPKADLASGQVIGAEALLRWNHPLRGLISPDRFIPLAEETGLIIAIGEWVLAEICAQIKAWQRQGVPVVPVAVNLSARQFHAGNLVKSIRDIIETSGIEPCLLELELTESMIMRDPQNTAATLTQLKELGVSLALDDFGTGYSSLNYLRRFPVDHLKIDRSFISDVATDTSAAAVATSIVAIAHSLGLQAVAEGVENRDQLDFLTGCGCDSFQGYYFCRPVPVGEFTALLNERRQLAL